MNFWQLITVLGGWTLVLTGIIRFIANNVEKRVQIKWQGDNDKQLSILRGEIDRQNALVNRLLTSHSDSFNQFSAKKIESIGLFWKALVSVRKSNYGTETLYNILLQDELLNIYKDKTNSRILSYMRRINDNYAKVSEEASAHERTINEIRPFIGEKLFNFYYAYSAFCLRASYLLIKDIAQDKVTLWANDEPLKKVVNENLTSEELKFVEDLRTGSYTAVLTSFETKMIFHISYSFTGQEAVDNSLNQIQKIKDLMDLANKREPSVLSL